jgi:CPA2 family monovalent cation:H+ antiporter-2
MAALLLEAGVVLGVIAVGGALAGRLDQSVIPAYILVGLLVGPFSPVESLSVVQSREFIDLLAELGVVLLLFFIGLEFNVGRLVDSGDRMLKAGGVDLAVNFTAGGLLGLLLGFGPLGALLLAGVTYISSSAVVTKTLVDLGWIADPESEAILGVLVFEDVVIAVYLAIVAALLGGGGTTAILTSLALAGALIVGLLLLATVGTPLLDRLFQTASDELFVLRVLALAVLVGGVALALGVSEAVAAFFLGTAFAGTDHVERIERVLVSERDIYAAVFFFAIGLETDPSTVVGVLVPVLLLAAVTAVTKFASGYAGGRAYGLSGRRAVRTGLGLVARGEFSLVIAALALSAGLPGVASVAVGYVLVMSVLGTVVMRYSGPFERLAARATGTVA